MTVCRPGINNGRSGGQPEVFRLQPAVFVQMLRQLYWKVDHTAIPLSSASFFTEAVEFTLFCFWVFKCLQCFDTVRILLEQETVSGSGIRWATCKSAPRSRQRTTPTPHHSFFTGRMSFLSPNSIKALKAISVIIMTTKTKIAYSYCSQQESTSKSSEHLFLIYLEYPISTLRFSETRSSVTQRYCTDWLL